MSNKDISSNPFAALISSSDSPPQQYSKKLSGNEDTAKTDDGLSERFKASCIIGDIFLVTLEPGKTFVHLWLSLSSLLLLSVQSKLSIKITLVSQLCIGYSE